MCWRRPLLPTDGASACRLDVAEGTAVSAPPPEPAATPNTRRLRLRSPQRLHGLRGGAVLHRLRAGAGEPVHERRRDGEPERRGNDDERQPP